MPSDPSDDTTWLHDKNLRQANEDARKLRDSRSQPSRPAQPQDTGRPSPGGPPPKVPPAPDSTRSFKRGGIVRKTGVAVIHKGERVLTKRQAKRYRGRSTGR